MRTIYRCLIRLHPLPFKARFHQEMLWIFDEAACGGDEFPFIRDAFVSLLRQWFVRPRNYSTSLCSLLNVIFPLVMAAICVFCGYSFALAILIGPLGRAMLVTVPAVSTLGVLSFGIYRFLKLARSPSDPHVWINLR